MMRYERAVDEGLEGLDAVSSGPSPGCAECGLEGSDVATSDVARWAYDEAYQDAGEPYFSGSSCDACSSTFGGDRYAAHGLIPNVRPRGRAILDALLGRLPNRFARLRWRYAFNALRGAEIVHLAICVDCVMYLANGDVPDEWTQTPGGI